MTRSKSAKGPASKGRFRIQSVAEMTGVPASTLRAWEQRYGFPAPERTASSYRVYSEDDVELIASVRAKCDAGMAPAEAVSAVLEEGRRPAAPTAPVPVGTSAPTDPGKPSPLTQRIVAAATDADPAALDEAIRSALMLGSHTMAYASALAPAWSTLRELWAQGELDAGRARIALEVLGHAARDFIRLGQPAAAAAKGNVVIAPAPGQDDIIPLLPVAFAAQAETLRANLLAPRATVSAIAEASRCLHAQWVAVGVSETIAARGARELFDDIGARVGETRWFVCGPATNALRSIVEACGGEVFESPVNRS